MGKFCFTCVAVTYFLAGCGLRGVREPDPPEPVPSPDSYGPSMLELRMSEVIPVGDSVWYLVSDVRCRTDGRWCAVQPIADIDVAAWSIEPGENLAITPDGELIARHVGHTTVRVSIGTRSASAKVAIIPLVASFRWEPDITHAAVGDTIRIQAIARDAHGIITAIIPAARVTGPGALSVHLIPGGLRGTLLIPHGAGTVRVIAELGHHIAEIEVVVGAR
jgi:hypothetical protein